MRAEEERPDLSKKAVELAWTRERLLLVAPGHKRAPSLAASYEALEARKRTLEEEIARLAGQAPNETV